MPQGRALEPRPTVLNGSARDGSASDTWRSWALGVFATLALSCGRASDGTTLTPLELATGPLDRSGNTAAPGLPTAESPEDTAANESGEEPGGGAPLDPRRATLLSVIERECAGCHAGDSSSAPSGNWLDLENLESMGMLLWGSGEASRLALWVQYGDSRPEHANLNLAVSGAEYADIVGYINDHEVPGSGCGPAEPVPWDVAQAAMVRDIQARPPADRAFVRYIGLLDVQNGVDCFARGYRTEAIFQLLNAVSLGPRVMPLEQINPGDTDPPFIFAIDIRDYGWNRPLDAGNGGPVFGDVWAALVDAVGPFAIELAGPDADALKRETTAAVPMIPANAFTGAAAVGSLYYALIGVGSDLNVVATGLGVTTAVPHRAGMFGTAPLRDGVVTRREQSTPGGTWWTRDDVESLEAGDDRTLRDAPLDYPIGGSEVIFTLPNGSLAFAIAGADGTVATEAPKCVIEFACGPPLKAENSVTCRGCHSDGLEPVTDQMLEFANANPDRYDPNTLALIREQYRPELWLSGEADSQRYRDALEAQYGTGLDNSIGRAYYAFTNGLLGAQRAATELGVTVAELRDAIGRSAVADLTPLLADGRVDRNIFKAHFAELACSVSGRRNVPVGCPPG
jgi:hypothetical protein